MPSTLLMAIGHVALISMPGNALSVVSPSQNKALEFLLEVLNVRHQLLASLCLSGHSSWYSLPKGWFPQLFRVIFIPFL